MFGIPEKKEPQDDNERIIIDRYMDKYVVRRHGRTDGSRADQKIFRDKKQLREWLDGEFE